MNDAIRPSTYREEVAQYTKKDAIHALLYIGYIALVQIAFKISVVVFDLINHDNPMIIRHIATFVNIPLFLIPLFVVLRKKRQKISSVGLHLIDWKKALCVGLFIAVVFLMLFDGLLPGLLGGWRFNSLQVLLPLIAYILLAALWEDIVFIGYMQTRIHGLIKNDILAVGLGGFIFAALHYPGLIAANILDSGSWGGAFWGGLAFSTLTWIVGHAVKNAIFRRYRSIITVTLYHFAWNLAQRGALWENVGEGGFNTEISAAIGIFVIMTIVFTIPFYKNLFSKSKAAK